MSGLLVPQRYIGKGAARGAALKSAFDPEGERKKIMDRLPDIGGFKIFGQRVLVAKWVRDKLSENLHAAPGTQTEDKWQGKVGLVIAVGHLAFKSDATNDFGPDTVKVGDWVAYSYSDGHDVDYVPPGTFDKVSLKILNDVNIDGLAQRPDMFF